MAQTDSSSDMSNQKIAIDTFLSARTMIQ